MKNFDQLEVMPMMQCAIILQNLIFGLVLLDEARWYTGAELIGLFATQGLSIAGICILMNKKNTKKDTDESSLRQFEDDPTIDNKSLEIPHLTEP